MTDTPTPRMFASQGQAAYERGDFSQAGNAYLAASDAFLAAGNELAAAEARNNASVAFLKAGDGRAALQAVEGTPALFAQHGDLRRQGMALGNLAAALEALGHLSQAAETYRQSAQVLEQAGESELRAYALKSLSALQLRSGQQLQALASMQAGLEGIEKPTLTQRALRRLLRLPFGLLSQLSKRQP